MSPTMTISEKDLESITSKVDETVDKLEQERTGEHLKLLSDDLFELDADTDYEVDFEIKDPPKKDLPDIIYI